MHCALERPLDSHLRVESEQDVFVMPCSASQKRFWMLEQMLPGDTALAIPIAVQLSGPLDPEILERALNGIVQRHESLRTSFASVEGEPKQIIATKVVLKLRYLDLGNFPENERRARVADAMAREAAQPIPVTQAPLLRATLMRLAPLEAVLMLTAHHIISDGWSSGVMVRELGAFYEALRKDMPVHLAPLTIQYADYVLWMEDWLKSAESKKQLAYWKKELEGEIPVLDFPTDFARPAEEDHEAILESRVLPGELTASLKELARETGTTLFMIFFSAYLVLLQRYTGQSRLMVGTTGANRNQPELEGLIGLFANVLLLRAEVSGEMSFQDFLAQQRDHLLNSFANHEVPFDQVLEQWQSGTRKMPKSLIQTHFLFQKAFMQPALVDGLTIQPLYSVSPGSAFELTFGIVERGEGIRLQMEYRTSLFRQSTIQRFLAHFQGLLESIVVNPGGALSSLPIFTEGERDLLEAPLHASVPLLAAASQPFNSTALLRDLDQQIDEHFQKSAAPFTPEIQLPPGAVLRVLDEQMQVLPIGIPGDLYLADLSGRQANETVSSLSTGKPSQMKTGFIGRHTESGAVELWGRSKDLIPLPVFRFNRRSIGARLCLHAEVEEAVATVQQSPSGEPRLVGYAVLRPGAEVSDEDLRAFLREANDNLPLPSVISIVPSLPKDGNEMVITRKLPAPLVDRPQIPNSVPLQGMLQGQLIEIWRNILKTSEISADDNFFELGGNSFLALRMMIEVGKLCRRTLPLSLLLTGATVNRLSRFIIESNSESESIPLIPVQTKGTNAPLFFLHGDWVGGGFYCNRLSQQLGEEQPFYALPPSRSGEILSIEEMAAQHCAVIRAQFPAGPYVLGGYCIGAMVAIEMARQLMDEGQTVSHLFLVDPPVWADRWLAWVWPWFDRLGRSRGWDLGQRIRFFDRSAVAFNRWSKRPMVLKWAGLRRRFGIKNEKRAGGDSASAGGDYTDDQALDSLEYSTYYLAYRLYQLRELSVPATLFVPASTSASRISRLERSAKIDPTKSRVELVPGNHTTCVTQDTTMMVERMRSTLGAM